MNKIIILMRNFRLKSHRIKRGRYGMLDDILIDNKWKNTITNVEDDSEENDGEVVFDLST